MPVSADGAAVIPSQWGGKTALRPYLNQITGAFPGAGASFSGITDVIGSTAVNNVRSVLMARYPGEWILELPGGQDLGSTSVVLTVPSAMSCPQGAVSA